MLNIKMFDDKETYNYWFNLMPKERKIKIDKSSNINDKKLSLGAGVLLYNGLNHFKIINPKFIYNLNGKPYIENSNIYFNISHKNEYVICAFSDKEIGVDIEKISSFSNNLINKVFNKEEIYFNNNYSKLWTIKESFMKYLGTGITLNPKDIKIDLVNNKCLNLSDFCNKKVYFKSTIIDDYVFSICSEYSDFEDKIEWFVE
jgi:4'-phosphopantetheinyl transferase